MGTQKSKTWYLPLRSPSVCVGAEAEVGSSRVRGGVCDKTDRAVALGQNE